MCACRCQRKKQEFFFHLKHLQLSSFFFVLHKDYIRKSEGKVKFISVRANNDKKSERNNKKLFVRVIQICTTYIISHVQFLKKGTRSSNQLTVVSSKTENSYVTKTRTTTKTTTVKTTHIHSVYT